MEALIPLRQHQNQTVIYGRDLHAFLEVKTKFADWMLARIEKYGFVAGQDFVTYSESSEKGRPFTEYALTLDTAKEVAMVEGNEKGKEARRYFIECEKQLQQLVAPRSMLEMLSEGFAQMAKLEKEQQVVKLELAVTRAEIAEVKAKVNNSDSGFYSILGYASLLGRKITLPTAALLGKQATNLSNTMGFTTGKVPDPRFGAVKIYHKDVLDTIFNQAVA